MSIFTSPPARGGVARSAGVVGASNSFALLAPKPERFLRRAVGVAEQHAVAARLDPVVLPRRHDEDVVRGEIPARLAHAYRPRALDHAEHGAVGAAVARAGVAPG